MVSCTSVYFSLLLFEQRDVTVAGPDGTSVQAYPWAVPLSVIVAGATCLAMAATMGDETSELRAHLDLRRGSIVYILLWNLWMFLGSTWRDYAFLPPSVGDSIIFAN